MLLAFASIFLQSSDDAAWYGENQQQKKTVSPKKAVPQPAKRRVNIPASSRHGSSFQTDA